MSPPPPTKLWGRRPVIFTVGIPSLNLLLGLLTLLESERRHPLRYPSPKSGRFKAKNKALKLSTQLKKTEMKKLRNIIS